MSFLKDMKEAFKTLYNSFNAGLTRQVEGPVQTIEEWRYSSTPSDEVGSNGEFLFRDTTLEEAQMHLAFDPGMEGVVEFADAHTKVVPYEIEDNDGQYTLFNITTDNQPRISFGRAKELFGGLEPWYKIEDELEYALPKGFEFDSVIVDPLVSIPSTRVGKAPEEYEDITHLLSDLVVEEIKGYTEEELVAAIELDDKKTAISDLVAGFEDADAGYSIKALRIAGSFDATDIGSAENAFLELSDLKEEYTAEKRSSMISYKDVLKHADQLQAVIDSGLVGKSLRVRVDYGRAMRSVYSGIDAAMGSADGQTILAEQVANLDALEAKLNCVAAAKVEFVARKASSAYGTAVGAEGVDIPDSVKQELYSGASGLTTFAVDIKYKGLSDVDLGMYANSISSLEATADKIVALCDNSAKTSTYSPPPIKVAQPQL